MSLSQVEKTQEEEEHSWLQGIFCEFRRRFITLLGGPFSGFPPGLALSLLCPNGSNEIFGGNYGRKALNRDQLRLFFTDLDLRRLSQYARNMADDNLITDLLPTLATLYFTGRIEVQLDVRQTATLLAIGLQRKSQEHLARELGIPGNQTAAFLNKAIRRCSERLDDLCKEALERGDGHDATAIEASGDLTEENGAQEKKKAKKKSLGQAMLERMSVGGCTLPASLDDEDLQQLEDSGVVKTITKVRKGRQNEAAKMEQEEEEEVGDEEDESGSESDVSSDQRQKRSLVRDFDRPAPLLPRRRDRERKNNNNQQQRKRQRTKAGKR